MKNLKFLMLAILSAFSIKAKAGGIMKGGVMDDLLNILILIYIGIPLLVGTIVAIVSKSKKGLNFFLGFLGALIILIIASFIVARL